MPRKRALAHHPLADMFPLIQGEEFDALVASIRDHGLREPIVVHDGRVIDGRNRQRACLAAGVACRVRPLPAGTDLLAFVLDANLTRRHLNESQRADVAAKLANLGHGGGRRKPGAAKSPLDRPAVTQAMAAKMLNVSERLVRDAKAVQDDGAPELRHAVQQGQIAVSAAAQAARFAPAIQCRIAAAAAAGKANAARLIIKQEARATRERDLGQREQAMPDLKAGLILEDYEWDDDVWSRETGMDRHAANHYPTSAAAHTPEEIVARRPIESIVDENCVLAMWATIQHLAIALQVMALRGFTYRSHFIWGKDRVGLGRWVRSQHEILLIGTRGSPPCPAPGLQWASLISAPRGEHSAKPEIFLRMLEGYFPTLVKIELNRRGPARPGWHAWGNQAETRTNDLIDVLQTEIAQHNGQLIPIKSIGAPQMGADVEPAFSRRAGSPPSSHGETSAK